MQAILLRKVFPCNAFMLGRREREEKERVMLMGACWQTGSQCVLHSLPFVSCWPEDRPLERHASHQYVCQKWIPSDPNATQVLLFIRHTEWWDATLQLAIPCYATSYYATPCYATL